ncbi:hypothetical protein ERJ70_05745 [Sediminibacillus dalangtanensis]|uniref:Intracellular septation protein A n=1 Tax=Sediminibacillus dalangtanensis TaxID=2729421 RepID=A0ABX7VPJ5_9BACI|nr:VC0807 family protein [Sediminibacillus dalangtanensis]QTM98842.1 hypothetical protein ERJ70_05745 [Sediminibacillus dalangtanensis]
MKKNIVLLDIIFYVLFPLFIWHFIRDFIGDYYTMLLSSVPGIIYSVYRFFELKRINFFGVFILVTLMIETLVDVLAGSSLQLLWNKVFYAGAMSLFFFSSIIIKKPITLYFGLDFAELQGYDRKFSKCLYYQKQLFLIFQLITLVFALRSGVLALVKAWLIIEYGVEAFDKGIILRQAFSWLLTGITIAGFFYIGKVIYTSPELIKKAEREMAEKEARPS